PHDRALNRRRHPIRAQQSRLYGVPKRHAAAATAGLRKYAAPLHCVVGPDSHRDRHAGRWRCVAAGHRERAMMRGAGYASARRGQSTVEFALIAIVLVGLLLAVIDLGRAGYEQHSLDSGAADLAQRLAGIS